MTAIFQPCEPIAIISGLVFYRGHFTPHAFHTDGTASLPRAAYRYGHWMPGRNGKSKHLQISEDPLPRGGSFPMTVIKARRKPKLIVPRHGMNPSGMRPVSLRYYPA